MENTNRKRSIHLELDDEYAPLYKRTEVSRVNPYEMQQARALGRKHIDIWADGSIYPPDPLTQQPPTFSGLTSLIKYVCEGNAGLLGYTTRLTNQAQSIWVSSQRKLMMQEAKIKELSNRVSNKENECNELLGTVHAQHLQNHILEEKTNQLEASNKRLEVLLEKTIKHGPSSTMQARERVREKRQLGKLSKKGGYYKRRVHAENEKIKNVIQDNEVLPKVMSKDMFRSTLSHSKFTSITDAMMQERLQNVKNAFTATDAQGICDKVGLSRDSYTMIYQKMAGNFKTIFQNKRVTPIPCPHSVKKARQVLNNNVLELIGEPEHIVHKHVFMHGANEVTFELNANNNFVLDVCKLQAAMVKFYGMSVAKCGGTLKFVLKLDESEIVKNQKLERVSLTLMNRALDAVIKPGDPRYFSVQSENDIWWLAAFEVPKETHEILKLFFNLTDIPAIIQSQNAGQILHVDGLGDYNVEWHLAGDLKTLKCMFGISNGANAGFPCLYCMCSRKKDKNGKKIWDEEIGSDGAPNRDEFVCDGTTITRVDPNWDPVLDIPLTRVHFCTLHAMCRIVEKLVYEYVCFAYKMQPISESQAVCKRVEEVLSCVGLHKGRVEIKKDEKRSGASGNMPSKPSIGGVKARKFLSPPKNNQGDLLIREPWKYDAWRKLHTAVPDRSNNGETRLAKAHVWIEFDKIAKLLQKMEFKEGDAENFEEAVNVFYAKMVEAWTSSSVTHYMHILRAHGHYFAKQGSLAIWSTQGMEHSHWQARCGFHKATSHGGGLHQQSALKQLLMWWYRKIAVRKMHDSHAIENRDTSDAQQL